ncbi:MAG: lipoyl domain-containing protein [Candidatus Bipolaricaulota bacterium]|nr:lipoyl domain-containing protein [Candidatus Bipolaricaulota bacterium]
MNELRLPDLGEIDEVKVVGWLKKIGDRVEPGEELLEVETNKTTFVVEAEIGGKITRILVDVGERASRGDLLAEIG